MNVDTGEIYRKQLDIEAAKLRGEPVVGVSERVADAVEIGMQALERAERRAVEYYGPRKPLREVRAELQAEQAAKA
jgi:hypothetical protein